MQQMTYQILLCLIHPHIRCQLKIFCNKSVSNMPLNVIKVRKMKLPANKFYQIIHKMQCFLQKFHQIIDIKLILSNKFYHRAPIFTFLPLNNMRNCTKKLNQHNFSIKQILHNTIIQYNNANATIIQSLKLTGN